MLVTKLNAFAINYLHDLNLSECNPINIQLENSVTIFPKDVDAFNLNSPASGSIKDIIPKAIVNDACLIRMLINYSTAVRISENPKLFNFYFSLYLNAGLSSLKSEIGDLRFRDITAFRPGTYDTVFRELEDSAAIEFRLFVKEKNV
jgi:hypothetical protein